MAEHKRWTDEEKALLLRRMKQRKGTVTDEIRAFSLETHTTTTQVGRLWKELNGELPVKLSRDSIQGWSLRYEEILKNHVIAGIKEGKKLTDVFEMPGLLRAVNKGTALAICRHWYKISHRYTKEIEAAKKYFVENAESSIRNEAGAVENTSRKTNTWTEEQDLQLVDFMLKGYRKGNPMQQLALARAYLSELNPDQSKSKAQVDYRWYQHLMPQYKVAVEAAKAFHVSTVKRKEESKKEEEPQEDFIIVKPPHPIETPQVQAPINNESLLPAVSTKFTDVMDNLNFIWSAQTSKTDELLAKIEDLEEQVRILKLRNVELERESEEYGVLQRVIERARRAEVQEEHFERPKMRMVNGSLELVK